MANMSAKFDEETQNSLVSIVYKLISLYVYCDLAKHPTLFYDAHSDIHLWQVASKINRVHSLTMVNMSAKFDEEAHNDFVSIVFTSSFPYMSIVTLTFDLWPPKSIGSILSLWLTCLPSLMKKHRTV